MTKNLIALKPGIIFLNSLNLRLDTPDDLESIDSLDILDRDGQVVGSMDISRWPFFKIETDSMMGKIKTSYIGKNTSIMGNSDFELIGSFDFTTYQDDSVDYRKEYKFNVWMNRHNHAWCSAQCSAYQMYYDNPNWKLFLNNGRDVVLFQQNNPKDIDKKTAEIRLSCRGDVPSDTYLLHTYVHNWQENPNPNIKVTSQAYAIAEKMGTIPSKELKYAKTVRKDNKEEAYGEYVPTPDLDAREVFMLAAEKLKSIDPELALDFAYIRDNKFGSWLNNILGLCYESFTDDEIETIFGMKPNKIFFQDGCETISDICTSEEIGRTKVYVPKK